MSQQGNAVGGGSERERDMGQKKENETQLKASQWLHSVVLVRLRSKKGEREKLSSGTRYPTYIPTPLKFPLSEPKPTFLNFK